jgi:signal peptidase I
VALAPGTESRVAVAPPVVDPRIRLVIAAGATLAAVALIQVYPLLFGNSSAEASTVASLAVPIAVIGIAVLAVSLEGRTWRDLGFFLRGRLSDTLAFTSLLTMVFLALRYDPGFFYGFGAVPGPDPIEFGVLLLGAPLIALAEVTFFVGYLFRTLTEVISFRSAILLSAAAFALYSTNIAGVTPLGLSGAIPILFQTTMVAFVLGIALALYSYKSQWSLVGPLAVLAAMIALTDLVPVAVTFPNWGVNFATAIGANAAILVIVGLGLRETRLQSLQYLGERIGPRRHRFREHWRRERSNRGLVATCAAVGVVALTFGYGLPTVLGTSQPILAIATGSMVPTLPPGTLVVIEHVAPSSIRVGTIIAFSVDCLPSPTVHRVIRIVSTGPNWVYQTKGDANDAQDPCTVPYADVHGAMLTSVEYAGYLILDPLFAGSIVVLILLVPVVVRGERP